MAANLRHANAFEHAAGIKYTPSFVIDGRYLVTGDHDTMLRTADALIASLRNRRR
jgi:predicted DsbA family dithiol-disulfide isomerase